MIAAILDAALGYADASPQWPVFPVHATDKRPCISTGPDHAVNSSTDPEVIRRWFRRDFPGCRLGIPTGWPTGTIVIDVDAKHDGETRLGDLERALGPLPRVRVVRTKSGGLHLYFARPVVPFRIPSGQGANSALGRLLGGRDGVDVRADGGFVVVPPTPGYTWIADDDEPPPALPRIWLAALLDLARPRPRRTGQTYTRNGIPGWALEIIGDASTIHDGGRNGTLFHLGCTLRKIGASESEILGELERANTLRCSPPLRDAEVRNLAAKAAKDRR